MSSPLADILADALKAQPVPVTAAQAAKLLPAGTKAREVAAALDEMVLAGRAFTFVQGKSAAYAVRPPLDLCAEALGAKVGAITSAVAPAKLRSALPKALQPWFDEALGRLIVQGRAHWLPKGKSKLVLSRSVRPSDVISASQLAAVQKVLATANRHRAKGHSVAEFLAWLDATNEAEEAAVTKPISTTAAIPSADLLRQWYKENRARSSSTMVPIPDTYQRYEAWAAAQNQSADEEMFRQALVELYNAGLAILEPCERPQDLPEHERRLQVPLTFGPPGYYWSPVG